MSTGPIGLHYEARRIAVAVVRPTPSWRGLWDICWKSKVTLGLMLVGLILQGVLLWVGP